MQTKNTKDYKQYSFEPVDFEHPESEEYLEIIVHKYSDKKEQLSDSIKEIYKKVFPKASTPLNFELELVSKDKFYQAFTNYSPSVKSKIEDILKNIDTPVWQNGYLLRFDNDNLQVSGALVTETDIIFISWYTTA